jgi:outer membrane protein TolC
MMRRVTHDDRRVENGLRSLVIAAALVGGAFPAQAQDTGVQTVPVVTLTEARQRSITVDPNAIAASQRIRVAGWEKRAATADLYAPKLNGSINYIRFSEPFFNFGTGNISPNAAAATLDASYVIIGAGKLGTLKSSRAALESAEANETATRFQTALGTDYTYFAVLASRELARVATERVKRAEEQLAIARVRVVAGEAIASDSLPRAKPGATQPPPPGLGGCGVALSAGQPDRSARSGGCRARRHDAAARASIHRGTGGG